MYRTTSGTGRFGGGLTGDFPRDVVALIAVVFVTFTLQFFSATAGLMQLLTLTPYAWQRGFLWQLVTYPFIGTGRPGFFFVLELIILFMFGRTVYHQLGRRDFWRLLVVAATASAAVAVIAHIGMTLLAVRSPAFVLMQGQTQLAAILVAAFATLNMRATILLFFVLPVEARWFLWLELIFAFMGYLSSGDLAGFLGIVAAVGITYASLRGGLRPFMRRFWNELQMRWIRLKLDRMRKKRGFEVVRPDEDRWVN